MAGVTFEVAAVEISNRLDERFEVEQDFYVKRLLSSSKVKGNIIRSSHSEKGISYNFKGNGFIDACMTAYNNHFPLVLSPDDVWIAITTSLSRYIDANAEKMRHNFVSHEGKIELTAEGTGSIYTVNYDNLFSQLSDKINEMTKDNIREWIECDFSTSTPITRIVSKVVLMGAMKHYFSYTCFTKCGLPKVTLLGTLEDWQTIRTRVDKMKDWNEKALSSWSDVLGLVLDNFVDAFQGKIDKDFWNRIGHFYGGGSGPSYLEGWILAFIAFTESGQYFLKDLETIKKDNKFGRIETGEVPPCLVEVPVKIDDNGVEYQTTLYAGTMFMKQDQPANALSPSQSWVLLDIL